MSACCEKYKLYYFDVRGLGEGIRLLLNYNKIPFEDIRYTQETWPGHKSDFFYGKLPALEINGGKRLFQSSTIARYLAEKYGLAGKDDWERAKVNEVLDFHKDVGNELAPYIYSKLGFRPGNPDELFKTVYLPGVKEKFPTYVKLLAESKSGFFAPSGVTFIDFIIADSFFSNNGMHPEIMKEYPELIEYMNRVLSLPQLKEYVSKRKV